MPNDIKYRSLLASCGCWSFPMWPVEPLVTHNITIMLQYYYITLFNILYYTILCVMLYYIITVSEACQNNWCRYLQRFLFNTDEKSWKYDQIYHEKYWFHCRDFHETQNRPINYCRNYLGPTSAKLGRGWEMQNMGENSYMLLCIVLFPLRCYSWNCNFQAYCWVCIPHWIVGKSTKNVRPGGQK